MPDGKPKSVLQGAARVTFAYDNANRRTAVNLPNGISTAYAWDGASQLSAITYRKGTTTVGSLTYTYDNAGRVSGRSGTLFQSVFPAAVTSATYDADNRLTQWAAASGTLNPTYDANGRQITDGGKGHGSHTLTWDARGRLTAIAATPASFAYDAIGRRTTATIAGTATGYLYDGADIVQELSGATPSAGVLTGLAIDQRFSRTTGGATSTFLTDFLGSTVALTDSTGTVRTSYAYDPYGVTTQTGAANTSAYQYTDRENDGATGLYYYRARYYNPAFGRFVSEDPIGLAGGVNLYAYAGEDPLGVIDPSGTENKPQSGHNYRESDEVCRRQLTNAEGADLLSRYAVPNTYEMGYSLSNGEYFVTNQAGAFGGFVTTTFSSGGLVARNVTTPVHVFVGTIVRSVSNSGGASYIDTHGFGNAGPEIGVFRDELNMDLGPGLFRFFDENAALYAQSHYPGC